jgi:hypothetical protein
MAKIWSDIEIDFQGKTHKVRPDLNFINHLEQGRGNSISMIFHRMSQGDLPSGQACQIIAQTINYAVVNSNASEAAKAKNVVTAEEVFVEMNGGIGVPVVKLVQIILTACMPEQKSAPAPGKKKTPAKK